jgi:phosphopantothenoylcysteine decarboxylase/phosphopantothenate--cysteine ligase
MKILITSGGTKVPIDDVRYIGNMSSGRYGAEIADQFNKLDHDVLYWHSKGGAIPAGLSTSVYNGRIDSAIISYKDYNEYSDVIELVKDEKPDIIISAAAVSDYTVDKTEGKLSSDGDEIIIRLKKAKKILPEFKKVSSRSMVVGFKLLVSPTYQEVNKAVNKVLNNGADYVVYNDLTQIRKGNTTRLVFSKNQSFVEVADAKELTDYILYEKYSRKNSNGL